MIRHYTLDADCRPVRERDINAWLASWEQRPAASCYQMHDTAASGCLITVYFVGFDFTDDEDAPPLVFEALRVGGKLPDVWETFATLDEARACADRLLDEARAASGAQAASLDLAELHINDHLAAIARLWRDRRASWARRLIREHCTLARRLREKRAALGTPTPKGWDHV